MSRRPNNKVNISLYQCPCGYQIRGIQNEKSAIKYLGIHMRLKHGRQVDPSNTTKHIRITYKDYKHNRIKLSDPNY